MMHHIIIGLCVLGIAIADLSDSFGCPETQVYLTCGKHCNRTCEDGSKYTGGACRRVCVGRCGCPEDRPVLHENRCIKFSECPKKEKTIHEILCPSPQVFKQCGSACNRTCEHGKRGIMSCQRICKARCACPSDKPVWHEEKCVAYEECLKNPDEDKELDETEEQRALKITLTQKALSAILAALGLN